MDPFESYPPPPWDLIAASLNGELTVEEETALNRWLSSSRANQEIFARCRALWEEGLADQGLFTQEDARTDWEQLRESLHRAGRAAPGYGGEVEPVSGGRRQVKKKMIRLAAAAVFAGAILTGGLLWRSHHRETIFTAAPGAPAKLTLPDGTVVELKAGGRLRLDREFHSGNRNVFLETGTATFDIARDPSRVFTIRADSASIRDLGTRVTVQLTDDSVMVTLLNGRVAFSGAPGAGEETKQLRPGTAMAYYPAGHRFGVLILAGLADVTGHNLLRFDRTPLSEVTRVLQEISGRTILLGDTSLRRRQLAARLDGETFDDAIRIICTSLNLECNREGDTYILKSKADK
ncbi:MAG TPA: FecR domain-containing protein [Puia sp.]|nr:FecR domain-containing protein [Puia sp.]